MALPAADAVGQPRGELLGAGHRALPEPQERAHRLAGPPGRPAFPVEQPEVGGWRGHPAGRSSVPLQCRGIRQRTRRHARRWDLAAIARDLDGTVALYVGGSDEDPYEHRQIPATRERVPQAEVLTFPGGHLTTSEHPDLLAAAIRDVAERHGVGRPAAASDDMTP